MHERNEIIKQLYEISGLKKSKFAELIGTDRFNLSRMFNNKFELRESTLRKYLQNYENRI